MPARKFTDADIEAAVRSLGEKTTLRSVRALLGGGDLGRIGAVIRRVRSEGDPSLAMPASPATTVEVAVPATSTSPLMSLLFRCTREVAGAANNLASIQADIAKARAIVTEEVGRREWDGTEGSDQVAVRLVAAETRADNLEKELSTAREELAGLRGENRVLREQLGLALTRAGAPASFVAPQGRAAAKPASASKPASKSAPGSKQAPKPAASKPATKSAPAAKATSKPASKSAAKPRPAAPAKDKAASGDKTPAPHASGKGHGRLTPPETVERIIALSRQGMGNTQISKETGVPRSTCSDIIRKASTGKAK
ncbi:MAG: DNA-binding protein [Desulfovibrio sp.]|jgi:hypothetical protein|nr:DNA-binding protein [Desulfovibrio sp.]